MIEISEAALKLMQSIEKKGYGVVVKRSPLAGFEVIAIHSETGERVGSTATDISIAASEIAELVGADSGARGDGKGERHG